MCPPNLTQSPGVDETLRIESQFPTPVLWPASIRWAMLAWWLLVALAGCSDPPADPEVRVVLSTLVTSQAGQDVVRGAELALEEAGGEAGGSSVQLEIYNTLELGSEEPLSLRLERLVAQQAADDPQVVAYIGPMASHQAKVSMPILNRAGIAQISSTTTWPGLTRAGFGPGEPGIYFPTGRRHFFRVAVPDDEQAAAAARWIAELGFSTAYLLDNSLAYGRGLSGIFEETARDLGVKIVGHYSVSVAELDREALEELPETIAAVEPEILFYAGGNEKGAMSLLRDIRRRSPQITILGTEGIQRNEVIEALGPKVAEGLLATNVALPIHQASTEAARRFVERYVDRYGESPQPLAASSYEAMRAILRALDNADSPTREGVLAALTNMGEMPGLLGPWRFDQRGDTSLQAVSAYRVDDGQWVFQKILD